MTTLLRYRLRHLRRHVLIALAVVLVAVALLVGTISQLLPMVESHPDKVAAWLSERAGLPVAFDRLDTRWTRRGPLLQLDGLRIGQGNGVRVGQAEVLVAMYSGLLPGEPLTELRLRGLALTLERADDGRWSVRGLPSSESGGDPLEALRRLGELQVIGGQLQVMAPSIGIQTRIPRVDVRLRVDGQRLRVGARGWINTQAPPLTAVLDFQRRQGDGQAWFAAEPADLAAWSPLLQVAGVQVRQGSGELNAWVQLHDHRVVAVTAEGELEQVQLSGAPLQSATAAPGVSFRNLQLRARWTALDGGWRVDAPRLRINEMYARILRNNRNDPGTGNLQQQLQEARWLIKNIQQRFDTILRVAQAIVERQKNFFTHGAIGMRPLVLREIADTLGLHESTISRVTTSKYMLTPFGTFELKYFFGSHVATEAGGAASSTAIRALIKQLIGAEDPQSPLSDSRIAELLAEQGFVVALRTVAKYREALKIAPANLRKAL